MMDSLLAASVWRAKFMLLLILAPTIGRTGHRLAAAPIRPPSADLLPEGAIARLGTPRFRHGGMIVSLAFAPDGKSLATGGSDAVVRYWDVKTGRQLHAPSRLGGWVESLAYSPDGTTLAASDGTCDHRVYLLDAATGTDRKSVMLRRSGLLLGGGGAVAFAPNDKTLAATTPMGEVALFDAVTLKQTAVLGKHDHTNIRGLVFSPGGRVLASSAQDATIRLWDVVKAKPLFVLRSEDTRTFPIVFARDGKWLISGGGTQERPNDYASPWKHPAIRIWDTATEKQLRVFKDTDVHGCIRSLALAPDGRTLAASCEDTLCLWDIKEGKKIRSLSCARSNAEVAALQFSPDGKLLAGSIGNTVALWNTATGRLLNLDPNESAGSIESVAVSGDGRLLAAGDGVGGLVLWHLHARRFIRRFRGNKYAVKQLVFSPDDQTLVSSTQWRDVRIWDVASGREGPQSPIQLPKDTYGTRLAFSPDGKLLAVGHSFCRQGGGPCVIRLLDAVTGVERQLLTVGNSTYDALASLSFSPEGGRLVGITINGETYSWRKEKDHFLKQGQVFQEPFNRSVVYWPTGVLTEQDRPSKSISLRNLNTGKLQRDLSPLLPLGTTLTISHDGRYIASGPYRVRGGDGTEPHDETLRVCEMASGRIVMRWPLPPHLDLHALAFTRDSRTLIAGMSDTTVLLWDVFPATRPAADKLPALWDDLALEARQAHRALASFLAAGDDGVKFLNNRLQPMSAPDADKVSRWLADLDNEDFAVRERATRDLAKVAPMIRLALERARKAAPLDRGRHLDRLLAVVENPLLSSELIRSMRAVAILEHLDTPAARRLLQRLEQGAPEMQLTREARAACRRLMERSAKP